MIIFSMLQMIPAIITEVFLQVQTSIVRIYEKYKNLFKASINLSKKNLFN